MKKLLLALTVFASTILYATPIDVDAKIEKKFNETFPKAEKVVWYESDHNYEVLFLNGAVKCRMIYNKEGQVIKTTRYYKEDGLCPFILANLKTKYSGKKIFGITEVNNETGIRYYIILEDDKKWYHVNADGAGNMTLDKKLNKA